MKRFSFYILIFVTCGLMQSCIDEAKVPDKYKGTDTAGFDFATSSEVTFSISYPNWEMVEGGSDGVYFEIYPEYPIEDTTDGPSVKTGLTPLFSTYTQDNGTWKGQVTVPAYVSTLYVYTPNAKENPVEEIAVSGNLVSVDCQASEIEASEANTYILKELSSDVFAFEDTYPEQGDYDMNDVLTQVDNIRCFGTTVIESTNEAVNYLVFEKFRLNIFENQSSASNGLGVEVVFGNRISMSNVKKIALLVDGMYLINEQDMYISSTGFYCYITSSVHARTSTCSYLLAHRMNNSKQFTTDGHSVELVVYYYLPSDGLYNMVRFGNASVGQSYIKPFLYRTETVYIDEYEWEVHIPNETPSPLATDYRRQYTSDDTYQYFQTEDDGSEPSEGTFYVRNTSKYRFRPYPFAMKLSGVQVLNSNLYHLLLPQNDQIPIDSIFTNYVPWVNDQVGDKTGAYNGWYLE